MKENETNMWPTHLEDDARGDEAADLAARYFTAIRDGRLGAGLYTEKAELHYGGSHKLSGDYVGYGAMANMFSTSAEAFPGPLVLTERQILSGGLYACALVDASSTDADGRPVRWLRSVVFRFEGELIAEQWLFDFEPETVGRLLR